MAPKRRGPRKCLFRRLIIALLSCLLILSACRSLDNGGGTDWATVAFSLPGSSSIGRLHSISTRSLQSETALILAVSGSTEEISHTNYLIDRYNLALQNLENNTVELSVPLNRSLRLVKVVFNQDLSLDTILQEQPTPFYTGISDVFTVSGSETGKTVTIDFNWTTVEFTLSELSSENRLSSVSGSSIQSVLTLAVPADAAGISNTNYLIDRYALALKNSGSSTVELSVPPNIPLRLVTVVFYEDLSLDTILQEQPTAFCTSVSDVFTMNAGETSKTVTTNFNGIPDVSFNETGFVRLNNIAGGDDNENGMTGMVDSKDRVLAAGWSNGPADKDMFVVRYNIDGTPDSSFGTGGKVVRNDSTGGNYNENVFDMVEDADGKIVVVGFIYPGGTSDLTVWRFNEDGSLDTSFATGGMFVHEGAAGGTNRTEQATGVTIDSSGRILVTGSAANNNPDYDMVILRLNSDGTLDSSFGLAGIVIYNDQIDENSWSNYYKIAIDAEGRILITGSSDTDVDVAVNNQDMHLWRYNSDGSPDTSFGSNGLVIHGNAAGGDGEDVGLDLAIDSEGRILVIGTSWNGSDDDMVIWRFNDDGSLDTAFGTDGLIIASDIAGGNGSDVGNSITVDANGYIVAAGNSASSSVDDMFIWRFDTDGQSDTTFGLNGLVIFDNGAGNYGASLSIDSDGKYVVVGRIGTDLAIWRYR